VSVIIPTIGRPTLSRAIQSILVQSQKVSEILIVDASPQGISITEFESNPLVRVLRRTDKELSEFEGRWTAAHNRNLGIIEAKSKYIALMDDDDVWHPNKIEIQMGVINQRINIISSTSVRFVIPEKNQKKRPRKLLDRNSKILKQIYGAPTFLRSSYYIATPSVIVPASVAKNVLMDEQLSWYEDTWWYHELELAGLFHEQIAQALVTVYADPKRSIARDSLKKHFEWAERLSLASRRYAFNYLVGIALRNTIWLRRFTEIPILLRFSLRYIKYFKDK
jgi:glycosyltransferase involved in cell wall biosynthesis